MSASPDQSEGPPVSRFTAIATALIVLLSACAAPGLENSTSAGADVLATSAVPGHSGIAEGEGVEPPSEGQPGETFISVEFGEGWRLIDHQRRGQPYTAAIITSDAALSRWSELYRMDLDAHDVDFSSEVIVSLTPSVSGSCPDITFNGLVIGDDVVHGTYEFPTEDDVDGCTADANPVTFISAVKRSALPDVFTLAVFDTPICGGCDAEVVAVDLTDEAALEAAQFGASRLAMFASGPPPASGQAYVMQWTVDSPNALLQSAATWTDPFAIGWYEDAPALTLTGFVTACTDCAEECVMDECAELPRIGDECELAYTPEDFVDATATITFTGGMCSISIETGYVTTP